MIQTSSFHAQMSSQLQMFMEYCEDNKVFAGRNVTVFDNCMRLFDTLLNNSLEEMIKKAEIIIYTGTLNCGIYKGGLYKRLLDRDVKNGLAPIVPKKPKDFGYLVTNMDEFSKSQFKEWCVGDCAYAKNYFYRC